MKRILMLIGIAVMLSSCLASALVGSAVGGVVGGAVDSISLLEKNENWEFNATLNSEDVKACKMKDAVVSAN